MSLQGDKWEKVSGSLSWRKESHGDLVAHSCIKILFWSQYVLYYIVLCCHVLLFVRYDNRSRSLVKSPPVLCRRQWSVRKRTRVTHTTITTTPPLSQICMYCNGGWDVTWFFFAFVSLILAASRLDLGKRTITEEKEATSKHAATKEREKGFTNQSKPSI